jgi:hypothetical protein
MLCYEDPNKKKEISFGTYLKKRGVERAEVEPKILEQYGITLPEEYWSVDKSKASRAVKTVSTSSDDEASVEGEKSAPKKSAPKKSAKKEEKSVEPVEEEKSVEPVEEEKSVEPVEEEKSVEPVEEEKSVEPVEEVEASVEGEKPAPKKSAPKKKRAKKEKKAVEPVEVKMTVEPVEEKKTVEPVEEEEKTVEPVDDELQEEPISDGEDESPKSITKKNGSLLKLGPDKFQVFWNDKTYIIDMEDNSVWTHDGEFDLITCVGEWNPETKEVEIDEE